MKKILIVEDNKTLAKLIATKIKIELEYEVEIAYTLKEAKLFLRMYKYFLVLTDLNLPDAPNGEIVDYVLSKENKTIVLSGNINKDFIKKIQEKNIIDYIHKGEISDIDYVITTIKRLEKNQKHKILVVDASMTVRAQMKTMLENLFFKVVTVAHGEEALNLLDVMPDISMILTDYKMPVVDGLQLTKKVRKKYDKNSIKIIAIASDKDESTNTLFLKNGANDFINKGFSREEFSSRIHNSIEALETVNKLTNQAIRDGLTGLYNRRYFSQNKEELSLEIQNSAHTAALATVEIDNIDKINTIQKNKIISTLGDILKTNISYKDLVVKFDDNEFYIIIKDTDLYEVTTIFNKVLMEVNHCVINIDENNILKFSISIGLAMFQDSLDETINQADMMLYNARQNGGNQLLFD